jgi:futalosine hydrolase
VTADILIVFATPGEGAVLNAHLANAAEASTTARAGTLYGHPCRLVATGMAAVNTAHALTVALEPGATGAARPKLVIQVGVGGAYIPGGVPVGAVALANEEVYGDVGVISPDGWLSSEEIGIPLVHETATHPLRFNQFPLDHDLVGRAAAAVRVGSDRIGRFLTLSQVTGVRAIADTLYERFGALVESMEGAAAAHICQLYDVPFLEIRGISNLVEDRDRSKWRIADAARSAQEAVLEVIEHLDSVLP